MSPDAERGPEDLLPPLESPQSSHGLLAPFLPIAAPGVTSTGGEEFEAKPCDYSVYDPETNTYRTRPSLKVGINDHGSLGINGALGGTGFQMPSGQATENLAVGWWGEGWLVEWTGGPRSLHYPSSGPNGPVTRIDDFYLESDRYVTYRVTVDLGGYADNAPLLVDFEWTLDKERCDLTLRTVFENQTPDFVDVFYKRVVDWDNLNAQGGPGFFWGSFSEDGRTGRAARVLNGNTVYECSTTALGSPLPDFIDLNAWPGLGDISGPYATGNYNGDGNLAFLFSRHNLAPGGKWTTFLRYECDLITPAVATPVEDITAAVESAIAPIVETLPVERPGSGTE